ncbi:hypothetical protein GC176_28335 [bacterium]|nr:hypothetical protein [bacterium]
MSLTTTSRWMLVMTCLLAGVLPEEEPETAPALIPGPVAMQRLQSLRGQYVEIALQMQDGSIHVQHARVLYADEHSAEFDRHFYTLPGRSQNLAARYFEQRLNRAFPQSDDDKALLGKINGYRLLSVDGSAVSVGPKHYVVLSITPLRFEPPEVRSAFVYRAVKLDPQTDPWQSTKRLGPSPWVIRYGMPDRPDQFEFRLPNPPNYPHQRIDSVLVHDEPEWIYDSTRREFNAAVVLTAHYINMSPVQGYFLLDADGFPQNSTHAGRLIPVLSRSTQEEIQKLKESALIGRRTLSSVMTDEPTQAGRESTQHILQYEFSAGRRYRVETDKRSTLTGDLAGQRVEITKSVTEHLTVDVESVTDDGAAVLKLTPDRYVVEIVTRADGKRVNRDVLDTDSSTQPATSALQDLQSRIRGHVGRTITFHASRRGRLRAEPESASADRLDLLRTVYCGYQSRWLPLLPENSITADRGWKEQSTIAGLGKVHAVWWIDTSAGGADSGDLAVRGHGDVRPVSAVQLTTPGTDSTLFTARLRLAADNRLPVSLELTSDDVTVSGSTRLQNARQHTVERLTWQRADEGTGTVHRQPATP